MLSSQKQTEYLLYLILRNQDLCKMIPDYSPENYKECRERLEMKLRNITGLDASFLIQNILEDNIGGVQEYLVKLY